MTLLLGIPGSSEWIFIIIALFTLLIMPIFVIVLYIKNRELKRQMKILTDEKNGLLTRLLDKS
jgi:ABC-type transport system involved in cytochrome bd biosynthesis fused ATPase/permease subunit